MDGVDFSVPAAETHINHVKKRNAKRKGAQAVFDAKGLKDYVTGFRRRKQERREHAQKMIAKEERKRRNEARSERNKALKRKLGIGDEGAWVSSSDSEKEEVPESVLVFNTGDVKTTVTTQPLKLHSDSGEDSEDDEGDKVGPVSKPLKYNLKKNEDIPVAKKIKKAGGDRKGKKSRRKKSDSKPKKGKAKKKNRR